MREVKDEAALQRLADRFLCRVGKVNRPARRLGVIVPGMIVVMSVLMIVRMIRHIG